MFIVIGLHCVGLLVFLVWYYMLICIPNFDVFFTYHKYVTYLSDKLNSVNAYTLAHYHLDMFSIIFWCIFSWIKCSCKPNGWVLLVIFLINWFATLWLLQAQWLSSGLYYDRYTCFAICLIEVLFVFIFLLPWIATEVIFIGWYLIILWLLHMLAISFNWSSVYVQCWLYIFTECQCFLSIDVFLLFERQCFPFCGHIHCNLLLMTFAVNQQLPALWLLRECIGFPVVCRTAVADGVSISHFILGLFGT